MTAIAKLHRRIARSLAAGRPIGQRVIVQTERCEVYLGRVAARPSERVIILERASHVSWCDSQELLDLARIGPAEGRITDAHESVEITDVVALAPLSAAASRRFSEIARRDTRSGS